MTESSPELRALLRQARTAYSPSRSELEAVLVELEAHAAVNTPPSSDGALWSHAPRWLSLGVLAMAVGAAFYLQKPETAMSPAAPSPSITSAAPASAFKLPPTAAAETSRADAAAEAPPRDPSSAVPRRTRRAARTAAVTRTEVSQRPAQANAAAMKATAESEPQHARAQSLGTNTNSAKAETAPEPNSAPDTLLLELPLLQSAQAALNQGRAAEALALIERHTMRYPKGVLRQERIAAQVSALCVLGRVREATQLAQQLARIAPASPHLAKLHNSCVR